MKKLRNWLYLLASLFLIVACQSEKEKKQMENGLAAIAVKELSNDSIIKASTYFKSATVIPLETSDNCLLSRLEKVVLYKDKIYVLDNRNKAGVFCFDMTGKFLKIIGSQGTGPHEHSSLHDFSLDKETDLIYLNDRIRNRILVFTIEGEYKKGIPMDDYFTKIEVFKEHLYLAENSGKKDSYDLVVKNMEGKTISKYFPAEEGKWQTIPQLRKTSQGVYYYPNRLQDSLYSVFKNGMRLFLYADFGKHAIKPMEREKLTDMTYINTRPLWQTLLENDYIGGFSSVFVFNNLIVLSFTYQMNGGWLIFYEKPKGEVSVACRFVDDLSYLSFNYMVSQTDHQLICSSLVSDWDQLIKNLQGPWVEKKYVTSEEVEKAIPRLKVLQSQLTEDSNPLIVIYDLK